MTKKSPTTKPMNYTETSIHSSQRHCFTAIIIQFFMLQKLYWMHHLLKSHSTVSVIHNFSS